MIECHYLSLGPNSVLCDRWVQQTTALKHRCHKFDSQMTSLIFMKFIIILLYRILICFAGYVPCKSHHAHVHVPKQLQDIKNWQKIYYWHFHIFLGKWLNINNHGTILLPFGKLCVIWRLFATFTDWYKSTKTTQFKSS